MLEPYEKWMPGDKAKNLNEFITFLEESINDQGKWKREREWLRDIIFEHKDAKCRERFIRYFWK